MTTPNPKSKVYSVRLNYREVRHKVKTVKVRAFDPFQARDIACTKVKPRNLERLEYIGCYVEEVGG